MTPLYAESCRDSADPRAFPPPECAKGASVTNDLPPGIGSFNIRGKDSVVSTLILCVVPASPGIRH